MTGQTEEIQQFNCNKKNKGAFHSIKLAIEDARVVDTKLTQKIKSS